MQEGQDQKLEHWLGDGLKVFILGVIVALWLQF